MVAIIFIHFSLHQLYIYQKSPLCFDLVAVTKPGWTHMQKWNEGQSREWLWQRVAGELPGQYSSVAQWTWNPGSTRATHTVRGGIWFYNQIRGHHRVACQLSAALQSQEGSGITPSTHLRRMPEESAGLPLVHWNWMWSLWGAYSVSALECLKPMLCVVIMAWFTVQGSAGHRGTARWVVISKTRRVRISSFHSVRHKTSSSFGSQAAL